FGSQSTHTGGDTGTRRNDLYSDQRRGEGKELQQRDQSRIGNQIGLKHERLFNTLQRAGGRTGEKDRTAANTNRAIDSSQSSFKQAKQLITATNTSIGEREQQTQQREQHAQQVLEASQQAQKEISRGIELEL
ncbi:hypothetical protein, partial [Psychrobacter celer]